MQPSHLLPSWSVPAGQYQGPTEGSLWGPDMKQSRGNSSTGLLVSAVLYVFSCFRLQIELFSLFSVLFSFICFSSLFILMPWPFFLLWMFFFFMTLQILCSSFLPLLPDITKATRVFFLLSSLTKFLSSIFHCFRTFSIPFFHSFHSLPFVSGHKDLQPAL